MYTSPVQIQTIFFDLDDTLYPKDSGVWQAVRRRIEDYMRQRLAIADDQVFVLREKYLQQYGTSLRGLMADYQIDPDDYLTFVHDVDIEKMIPANPALGSMLAELPQRKWIFTNSSVAHSQRVLAALGIGEHFEGILDVKAMNYRSKPDASAYALAIEKTGTARAGAALFLDDQPSNLQPAKQLGAGTVLVGSGQPHPAADHQIGRAEDLLLEWPALAD